MCKINYYSALSEDKLNGFTWKLSPMPVGRDYIIFFIMGDLRMISVKEKLPWRPKILIKSETISYKFDYRLKEKLDILWGGYLMFYGIVSC